MPIVRRAERQVGIAALPGVRKTAADTPASLGVGLEYAKADKFAAQAGFGERAARIGLETYGRIVEEERTAADQTALLEANNTIAEWKNQRLFDPETGAFAQKGKAAQPLPEQIQQEFDKVTSEIEKTLHTDRQRTAFANLRAQEWQALDLQVRRHVFGEMQQFQAGELKSLVENSVNAAISSASDPALVAIELEKAVSAIATNAPRLGLGPEAIEAQVRAVQSQTHVGVISKLLADENDQAAQAYFEAAKSQIDGEVIDQVVKALDEGTLRGQAQKTADEIIRAGGTLTEQLEKTKGLEPKLRDQVEQRLEHKDAVTKRAKAEEKEADMRSAYDILDRTPNVAKIPPTLWTSFDGGTRSAMLSYATRRAKGEPIETDLATYYQLMVGAGVDPTGFAADNLLRYRHKLDEGDFKQLAGLQLSIKNGDAKATEKELGPFRTRGQVLEDTLTAHGMDPNAKANTEEGKAIAQLRRMLDRRVELLQGTTGKKASNEDIQAELDALLSRSVRVPGSWWNIFPGGKSFTDTDKRLLDLTVGDIPSVERSQIEAALKARNQPVSDATVLNLYLETLLRRQK